MLLHAIHKPAVEKKSKPVFRLTDTQLIYANMFSKHTELHQLYLNWHGGTESVNVPVGGS